MSTDEMPEDARCPACDIDIADHTKYEAWECLWKLARRTAPAARSDQ